MLQENSSKKASKITTLKLLEDPSEPTIFWAHKTKHIPEEREKRIVGRPTNSLIELPPSREVHFLYLIVHSTRYMILLYYY